MKPKNIKLLALHFIRNTIKSKSFYIVGIIFLLLTAFAAVSGIKNHVDQNTIRNTHQSKARQSWEANPDKHPHRMAHFGTFAFRISQPLSLFDYGLENYTGNAVFLEAHRQNSANFSEASFSTGILRFGELSMAMLLQLVLPLILIFIGFSGIAADRQNGTLKILLSQGASWFEILLGRSFGLFVISLLFFTPVVLTVVFALLNYGDVSTGNFIGLRFLILVLGYIIFLFIVTITIIVISALSTTTKNALLRLLGLWLLMVILLPKSAQDLGEYWFPTPSKLAFTSAIEKDVIKTGDSHNPNDPYYKHLKDSVLLANNVNEVTELPFNYAGLVMSEGEKISATLYKQHQDRLLKGYQNQNNISKLISYINPYMAIKQLSMITSGTDFSSYVDFQNQAEHYRYELAQRMNELQIKHISPKRVSGSEGKKHVIGHEHWEEFSDFRHKSISFDKMINEATGSIISLIMWLVVITGLLSFTAKRAKAMTFKLLIYQFIRSKEVRISLVLIILLGLIGIFIGKRHIIEQQKAINEVTTYQKDHFERYVTAHNDDLGLLLYYVKFAFINPSNKLNGISIGQSDLNPSIKRITIKTFEAQKHDTDLINPMNLQSGNLDLSFVLIYLVPLLIIVIVFNVLSEETDTGTWNLVTIQTKSKLRFVINKLWVRFLFVTSISVLLFLSSILILNTSFTVELLLMFTLSVLYIVFWFTLSFFIISFKKSSRFNALTLLTTWLVLLILLPSGINAYVTSKYPVPEALNTAIVQRDGYHTK